MSTVGKLAASRVRHNKSGTILTGVAFALTACLLMAVSCVGLGMYRTQKEIILDSPNNSHATLSGVTPAQLETLKLHQNVESLSATELYGTIVFEKMNATLRVETTILPGIKGVAVAEGRDPEAIDEITGPPAFFERLGYENPKLGDTVEIPYRILGEGEVVTSAFTIVGFLEQADMSLYAGIADTRIGYSARVSPALTDTLPDDMREYKVTLRVPGEGTLSEADIEAMVNGIAADIGLDEKAVSMNTGYLMFATDPGTETIVGVVGISVLIALFAALVIYSIYCVSIIANVQELGKLRALGATKRQMRGLLLREGLLTALVSLPIGLLLGYAVARVCMFVMMTRFWGGAEGVRVSLLSLPVILLVIALVLVTALLSLLRPMRQASRISPIEAIRYQEKDAAGGAGRKGYDFMSIARLSSANMSRNRRRTLVTVATMAVGGILFLTVSSVASSATYLDYVREGLLFKGDFGLNFLYEENDETYTENNLNSLQIAETLGDDVVKAIGAIPGVTKVEPQLSVLAAVHHPGYEEGERYTIASFKQEDVPLYELDLKQGALDYDAMAANNGVAFSWDHGMEERGFKIGDPVKLTLFDGEREIPFEGTLTASFGASDGSFMIPEDLLKQYVTGTNPTNRLYVTVEGGVDGEAYPAVKAELQAIVDENEHLALFSMDEELAIAKIGIDVIRNGAYIILGILGVVGLMNLVNTMIIGVVTRRREIGMLEAVGMSASQLGSMLWREGLAFTGGTLALALTVGNLIGYLAFRWCVENGILGITHYHYPIVETLIMAAALILAQLLITKLLARYIHKGSLVERMQL